MSTEPPQSRFEEDEWDEWYRMTPLERWKETQKLWEFYLLIGGSLDREVRFSKSFRPCAPTRSATC